MEDNGEGIPSAKATDSLSVENRPRSRHGYALPNITHRLQLYFGNEAGMAMTSRPGEGTSVEIWLPIVEEEHKDER
ncbi:hypothetical protein D3C75_952870 [compost metagenome]